jgi:hypothetical protein
LRRTTFIVLINGNSVVEFPLFHPYSFANFLTGFVKNKVCTFFAIPVGLRLAEINRFCHRFCAFGGINRSLPFSFYSTVANLLSVQTLLFPNPVSRRGCYDKNERGIGRVYFLHHLKQKLWKSLQD